MFNYRCNMSSRRQNNQNKNTNTFLVQKRSLNNIRITYFNIQVFVKIFFRTIQFLLDTDMITL